MVFQKLTKLYTLYMNFNFTFYLDDSKIVRLPTDNDVLILI